MANNYPDTTDNAKAKDKDDGTAVRKKAKYEITDPKILETVKQLKQQGATIEEVVNIMGSQFIKKIEENGCYCPMDGSYVCPCERVNRLQKDMNALIINGNRILDFLKALIQTTDAELMLDILPKRIEEVLETDQSRF